jgi:hypothetical protein
MFPALILAVGIAALVLIRELSKNRVIEPPPQVRRYNLVPSKVSVVSGTSFEYPSDMVAPSHYRLWGVADAASKVTQERAKRFVETWLASCTGLTVEAELRRGDDIVVWMSCYRNGNRGGEIYAPINTELVAAGLADVEFTQYTDARILVLSVDQGWVDHEWKKALRLAVDRNKRGDGLDIPFTWSRAANAMTK